MDDQSSANNSTPIQQTTAPPPIPCTVCGEPSRGHIYGAIACEACKVFFRRNSQRGLHVLQCPFDGHCEINIHTRHGCAHCRLAKCFANGMQTELIRCSRSTTKNNNEKRKAPEDEVQIVSTVPARRNDPTLIPTLNLLRTDQSTLTVDQWNLLSNLSHCYDEHAGYFMGEEYMSQQYELPHGSRFTSTSIIELCQMVLSTSESMYRNNGDFRSLSVGDRSILLDGTAPHTASISTNFIFHEVGLLNEDAYYDALEMILPVGAISIPRRLSQRLDFDIIVMKMFLGVLTFSLFRYTAYPNTSADNFSNIQQVLRIQDEYIELMWRYLLYKYDHQYAVKCFSELIRCVLIVSEGIIAANTMQWFTQSIDSIIETTKQVLSFNP